MRSLSIHDVLWDLRDKSPCMRETTSLDAHVAGLLSTDLVSPHDVEQMLVEQTSSRPQVEKAMTHRGPEVLSAPATPPLRFGDVAGVIRQQPRVGRLLGPAETRTEQISTGYTFDYDKEFPDMPPGIARTYAKQRRNIPHGSGAKTT